MERTNNTEISRFVCGYDNKSVIFIRVGKTGRGSNKRSGRSLACASLLPPVRLRLRGPAGQQGDSPRLDRQTRQGLSTLPPPPRPLALLTSHPAPSQPPPTPAPTSIWQGGLGSAAGIPKGLKVPGGQGQMTVRGRVGSRGPCGSGGVCRRSRPSPGAAPAGACLSPESPAISGGQRRRPQTRAAPPVSAYSGPTGREGPLAFPQTSAK